MSSFSVFAVPGYPNSIYILSESSSLKPLGHTEQRQQDAARVPELSAGSHLIVPTAEPQEDDHPSFGENVPKLYHLLFRCWPEMRTIMGIEGDEVDLARDSPDKFYEPLRVVDAGVSDQ